MIHIKDIHGSGVSSVTGKGIDVPREYNVKILV